MNDNEDNNTEPEAETVLVMFKDAEGAPRAWARGPKEKLEAVTALAEEQLAKYKRRKREVNDPMGDDGYAFTKEVAPCA